MDPAAAIADLQRRFEPQLSEEYHRQTIVLSSFLLVSLLVSVGSVALRYLADAFWLFRFNRGIIQAHSLINWLICSSVFSMMTIPYLWIGGAMPNQFIFRAMLFVPLWCGVWSMAIATLVAPLSISRAQKPSKYALTSYPIMLNILIVLVPLLLFGSVTYCIVLGNRAGDEMFASYLALLRAFSSSSIDAAEVGGATQRLQETSVEMIVSWERLWTVYASFIAIALALFTYSSASYFHTLVVSMRALRAQRASSDKLTSLGRAYASLITTTIVTALISVLYLALACVLATKTGEISQSTQLMDGVALGSFWIFAALGGITNVTIFYRSIALYRTHSFPSTIIDETKISTTNINLSHHAPRSVTVLPFHADNRMEMDGMPASHILVEKEWEMRVDESEDEIEKDLKFARY